MIELLFQNQHYSACLLRDGSLVITRSRGGGKRLVGGQVAVWINAIRTAIDAAEANALCRAFVAT